MTEGRLMVIWIALTFALVMGAAIVNQALRLWPRFDIESDFYVLIFYSVVFLLAFGIAATTYLYEARTRAKRLDQMFSKKILDAGETERKKIAADLHDGLQQNLHSINFELQRLAKSNPPIKWKLDEISERINTIVDDVRTISSELYPHYLEKLGLKKSVEAMANNLTDSTEIYFETSIDEKIDSLFDYRTALNVYRIVQELCNNIVKHSSASFAKVRMQMDKISLYITVQDDGKGLNAQSTRLGAIREGLGISSVRQRIKMLQGSFESKPGTVKGTVFKITIPVKKLS
jgi:signal transduction histidine kinase